MAKRISVLLNDEQEIYFNQVKFSLDLPKGHTTHDDVINHCLLELLMFEKIRDDQVTNFLVTENEKEYHELLETLKHNKTTF